MTTEIPYYPEFNGFITSLEDDETYGQFIRWLTNNWQNPYKNKAVWPGDKVDRLPPYKSCVIELFDRLVVPEVAADNVEPCRARAVTSIEGLYTLWRHELEMYAKQQGGQQELVDPEGGKKPIDESEDATLQVEAEKRDRAAVRNKAKATKKATAKKKAAAKKALGGQEPAPTPAEVVEQHQQDAAKREGGMTDLVDNVAEAVASGTEEDIGSRNTGGGLMEAIAGRVVAEPIGLPAVVPAFNVLLDKTDPEAIENAALVACGLGQAPRSQQIIAMTLANKYGLDLFQGHLCLVEGQLYTRHRGLLYNAHRHPAFEGFEMVEVPHVVVLEDRDAPAWYCHVRCWRKDRRFGFDGIGMVREGEKHWNNGKGAENAHTRAQVRALRAAFEIAVPSIEEIQGMKDIAATVTAPGDAGWKPGQAAIGKGSAKLGPDKEEAEDLSKLTEDEFDDMMEQTADLRDGCQRLWQLGMDGKQLPTTRNIAELGQAAFELGQRSRPFSEVETLIAEWEAAQVPA